MAGLVIRGASDSQDSSAALVPPSVRIWEFALVSEVSKGDERSVVVVGSTVKAFIRSTEIIFQDPLRVCAFLKRLKLPRTLAMGAAVVATEDG